MNDFSKGMYHLLFPLMRRHCLDNLRSCYLCLRSSFLLRKNKSHQPLILSFLLPFLWLWMVCVESGPCASGTTLCFICTTMLDTGTRIPMLAVKTPLSASSCFEFLFQDAFGSFAFQMHFARNCPLRQLLGHPCQSAEKKRQDKHPVKALSGGFSER